MATPGDKYHTELYITIRYYNDCNGASLSNEKIRDAIRRVFVEEEADAHNVTVDTFSQTHVMSNTQGENEKKLDK